MKEILRREINGNVCLNPHENDSFDAPQDPTTKA
jgi:hypothetical protein